MVLTHGKADADGLEMSIFHDRAGGNLASGWNTKSDAEFILCTIRKQAIVSLDCSKPV
jgi:hypothetical protein